VITALVAVPFGLSSSAAAVGGYDPLKTPPEVAIRTLDLTVHDVRRNRDNPILIYLPERSGKLPVVLFSHGLGGTRYACKYLGEHWAKRGYAGVFLQHPGSDDSVWRDTAVRERMRAMERAASGSNFLLRVQDVPAVLDQLAIWNRTKGHPLHSRLDLRNVGMSGHSFGAVTTQAVSGQSYGAFGQRYTDRRISAAIAFSPSSPRGGLSPAEAFGSVKIPWMLMTGTRDVAAIGVATVESRLAVFPALPAGDKYELVLKDAEHSAFTDNPNRGGGKLNPNHHRAILALSTAFWDAYLRKDAAAKRWLQSDAVRAVLEPEDRWQRK